MKTILLLASLLALPAFVQGQFVPTTTEDTPDSSRGYWQVATHPATRRTTVQFFDEQKNVLYEETLAGSYINLNHRTVKILDQKLHQLIHKNWIASSLTVIPLPREKDLFRPRVAGVDATMASGYRSVNGYYADALSVKDRKLEVRFLNELGYRMTIKIEDKKGQNVYFDSVVMKAYRRRFDFNSLEPGRYTLTISSYNHRFYYSRQLELTGSTLKCLNNESATNPTPSKSSRLILPHDEE